MKKKHFLLGLAAMLLPWTAWADAVQGDFIVTGIVPTYTYSGLMNLTPAVTAFDEPLTKDDHYTVSYTKDGTPVDVVKDVGHYEMTITGLKGGYVRYSPTTVVFDITKKEVTEITFTKDAVKREYDGSNDDSSVLQDLVTDAKGLAGSEADKADELTNFLKCLKVVRQSGQEETEANGTYFVSVQGHPKDDDTGSNYYFPEQDYGSWVRMNITPIELTASLNFDRQYNGEKLEPKNLNGRVTFDKVIEADKKLVKASLSYSGTGNLTDAASYTLDLTLTGDKAKNYKLATETIEIAITKVPLTITLKEESKDKLTKAYDGKTVDVDVTEHFDIVANPSVSSNDIFGTQKESLALAVLAEISKKGEIAGNAGDYNVGLYQKKTDEDGDKFEEADLKNYSYEFASKDYAYVITGKQLPKEAVTYSENKDLLVYQGKAFEIQDGFVTVKDGEDTLEEGKDYNLILTTTYPETEGAKAKDATDKFTVTVKGKGNYAGTELISEEFTITKATLTIEPIKDDNGEYVRIKKTYGEADPENFMSYYKIGLKGDDTANDIGLTMDRAKDNVPGVVNYEYVGDYPVRLYVEDKQIKKSENDGYNTALKNYNIEYDVNGDEVDTKFHIEKRNLNYHIAPANHTYSSAQYTPTFTVYSSDLVKSEELNLNDEISNIFTVKPEIVLDLKTGENGKDAGVYALKVNNVDDVEATNYTPIYVASEELDGKYTVDAAELTIKALNQEIEYLSGDEANLKLDETHTDVNAKKEQDANIWFSGIQYAWEWKKMIQELGDLVIETDAEVEDYTEKVGEHIITFDADAKEALAATYKNYNIKFEDGILTVKGAEEIVLNRNAEDGVDEEGNPTYSVSTQLKAYNGQSVKVKIEQVRRIPADTWTVLTLPFKTTTRELCDAFNRYVVVDVPNESGGGKESVSFRLHIAGEIDANTMMLIKIDEELELGDYVTFDLKDKERTIEYNPEEAVRTDNYGNIYKGVYIKEDIWQKSGAYYVGGGDGKFYSVADRDGETWVNPLQGYIILKDVNDPTMARIYVEEPNGSTTAINAITGEVINNNAEGWYTVGGMKLEGEPTQKGVYINNGKKVVIK